MKPIEITAARLLERCYVDPFQIASDPPRVRRAAVAQFLRELAADVDRARIDKFEIAWNPPAECSSWIADSEDSTRADLGLTEALPQAYEPIDTSTPLDSRTGEA